MLKKKALADRISLTLSPELREKLDRYTDNWALGDLKGNRAAVIQDLINRFIPDTP